jgi:hypothetical protein
VPIAHLPIAQLPIVKVKGAMNPQLGHEPPAASLRTVRRAVVGRWWLQVKPLAGGGFQAMAHTMSGPPGLWAGEVRATLGEATDDAIDMAESLGQHD